MKDIIAASDSFGLDLNDVARSAPFYVVSQKKFSVLFLATLGMYVFYWCYKQWSCYNKNGRAFGSEKHVWPVARALFPYFFTHALFNEVNRLSKAGALNRWANPADATLLVTLMVVSIALSGIGSPYTDLLLLAVLFPLLLSYSKEQAIINASYGDTEGAANCKFTYANYAWIAIGGICWLHFLAGLKLPAT